MLKTIVPLLMATALAGCSGSDAVTSPTAPSFTTTLPPVSTAQNIALQLRGFVTDTAFRPLAGARVRSLNQGTGND